MNDENMNELNFNFSLTAEALPALETKYFISYNMQQ